MDTSIPTPTPAPVEPVTPAAVDAPRIRVLFADDEEQFRIGLARRLERAGFDCTLVVNGHEALQRLQDGEFDVLLARISSCLPGFRPGPPFPPSSSPDAPPWKPRPAPWSTEWPPTC